MPRYLAPDLPVSQFVGAILNILPRLSTQQEVLVSSPEARLVTDATMEMLKRRFNLLLSQRNIRVCVFTRTL